MSEHRRAVSFQTRSEAQFFIEKKARRYRGSLFFATRGELLQSCLDSEQELAHGSRSSAAGQGEPSGRDY
jgi:hypothetical protein